MAAPALETKGLRFHRTAAAISILFVIGALLWTCGGGGGGPGEVVVDTTVYGRVLSAVDESPMEGVTITVADVGGAATTDAEGRFMFPLPSAGTYAVTARLDGYTYAQRRATAADKELVSVPDMFLTPLDPKEILMGPDGGIDTNSTGTIELEVPPGALGGTVSMRATWFERGKYLPNFLPDASHFTYACELTPDGQEFAEPVTVRLRNERGFAPGTPIPIGVYSPETLEWTHESMAVVTPDGAWAEFEVEHFSPRDCNLGPQEPAGAGEPGDAEDVTDASRRNNQPCGAVDAGSSVDVMDGHLAVDHVLPAYQALSQPWTIALQYNSTLHNGLPILGLSYDISETSAVVPERMRFLVEVGGQRVERFFQPVEGPMDFFHRWDGRDGIGRELPDGVYSYRLTLANEYEVEFAIVERFGGPAVGTTGVTADELRGLASTFEGTVALRRDDPARTSLGAGWGIVGVYELYALGDQAFVSGGDGNVFVFTTVSDTQYEPTRGNFTELEREGTGYLWTRKDRTRVLFDSEGRMATRIDLNGNTVSYGYDGAGRLSTRVDPLGGTTTFAYDAAQRLSSITDPQGRATQFQIDSAGDLVRITNPDGSTRSFTYDDQHRLISQTDAGGHTTTYHYDRAGAVVQVDLPDGSSSGFSTIGASGSAHLRPGDVGTESNPAPPASSAYTDAEDNTYAFTVNTFGTRTSITDPLGRTQRMHRDRDDLLESQQAPGSDPIPYEYDASGNLTRIGGPSAGAGVRDDYGLTWDTDLNALLSVTDDAVGTVQGTYDANGNLISATMMDGRRYTFTNDERGLRETATIGDRTTRFVYDNRGNLSGVLDPTGGEWAFVRDAYGNVASTTDPDGRTHSAIYDSMNLPESFTNGAGDTVEIDYTPAAANTGLLGRRPIAAVASIRDGRGNPTRFEYDEMYRVIEMTDPLGRSHSYQYDPVGRLRRHTMPTGDWVQYSYDPSGALVRKELSSGEVNVYTYDDATGRLSSLSNDTCTLSLTYDGDGFVSSVGTTFASGGLETTLEYEYRSSRYPERARTLTYGPGALDYTQFFESYSPGSGWLPEYVSGGDGVGIYLQMTYDNGGRLSGWTQSGNWASATFEYDDADRLAESRYYDGTSSLLATLEWRYSPGGYLVEYGDGSFTNTFSYDDAGRLTSAAHGHPSNPDERYSYDRAGNRRVEGSESDYVYDAANQLRQDGRYTYDYDASGNRTMSNRVGGGVWTSYEYDSENRLIQVTQSGGDWVRFAYDPLGRLAEKLDSSGAVRRYVYDQDEVLAEFDGAGNLARRYITRDSIDMLLGVISGGDHYFAGTDRLGTVIGFLDDGGDSAGAYHYQAFGQISDVEGAVANERTFAGREYETVSGLYHMRARFYDPVTGQFLQREPLVYRGATAPYVYAGNNPTNYRDPYGLEDEGELAALGGMFKRRVSGPLIQRGIGEAIGRIGNIPNYINPSIVPLDSVGTLGRTAWGQYNTWKDIIQVFGSDNPAEAGIRWWDKQWWNPVRGEMLNSFLTMGGTLPRREARIRPICGLTGEIRRLIEPQLNGSRRN